MIGYHLSLLLYINQLYLISSSFQAFAGVYEDQSGPEMAKLLSQMSAKPDWPLEVVITQTAIVPDEKGDSCLR